MASVRAAEQINCRIRYRFWRTNVHQRGSTRAYSPRHCTRITTSDDWNPSDHRFKKDLALRLEQRRVNHHERRVIKLVEYIAVHGTTPDASIKSVGLRPMMERAALLEPRANEHEFRRWAALERYRPRPQETSDVL